MKLKLNASTGVGVVALLAFVLVLVALGPLATIAAINTLFGTTIPFTFGTWLAAFWLAIVLTSTRGE